MKNFGQARKTSNLFVSMFIALFITVIFVRIVELSAEKGYLSVAGVQPVHSGQGAGNGNSGIIAIDHTLDVTIPPVPQDNIQAWYYDMTVNDYIRSEAHNKKWDQKAIDLLSAQAKVLAQRYSAGSGTVSVSDLSQQFDSLAKNTGCHNRVVHFYRLKLAWEHSRKHSEEAISVGFQSVVNLIDSKCSPWGKTLAIAWLAKEYLTCPGVPEKTMHRKCHMLMVDFYRLVPDVLRSKLTPEGPLADLTLDIYPVMQLLYGSDDAAYKKIVDIYDKGGRKQSAGILAIKGRRAIARAWENRRKDYSSTLSSKKYPTYKEDLGYAQKYLLKAHSLAPLNSDICNLMMSVCLGLGKKNTVLDKWFNRSVEIHPQSAEPYIRKAEYLLPQWHGSTEEALSFAREALEKAASDGRYWELSSVICFVHKNLSGRRGSSAKNLAYWKDPQIWQDYLKVYAVSMKASVRSVKDIKNSFLVHGVLCGQRNAVRKIAQELGPDIDYGFFSEFSFSKKTIDNVKAFLQDVPH